MMKPASKQKLQSFIEKKHGGPDTNPHGPNSPPRQGIADADAVAVSASSPLGRQHDKKALEPVDLPMPPYKTGLQRLNSAPRGADMLQIKESPSQREAIETRPGWESAPPASLKDRMEPREEEGLRERWEEQSNIHSLFSESAPERSNSAQSVGFDDTHSDIMNGRPRSSLGRSVGRLRSKKIKLYKNEPQGRHLGSASFPHINVVQGKMNVDSIERKGFSTSMVTHAPKNAMPEASTFQEDPFDTTSEERSPRHDHGGNFIHSSFPYRGSEGVKAPSHFDRLAHHIRAAKELSPEKYDGAMNTTYPQAFTNPVRKTGNSHRRPVVYDRYEDSLTDSDDNGNDDLPQADELEQQQDTPKAAKQKVVPQDSTVILNPQKPIGPMKTEKNVTLQEPALAGSPIPRNQSPLKKRRHSIDYDEADLQKMSFEDLQNEPFDHDPTRDSARSPARPPADNLVDQLSFYRKKDEDSQSQFFTQMSVRDWEDSGDWFLDQFADIVQRTREARQAKRKMVEQFEAEISHREEAVRRKKESIDRKLSKLKHDGDAMMKGKELND